MSDADVVNEPICAACLRPIGEHVPHGKALRCPHHTVWRSDGIDGRDGKGAQVWVVGKVNDDGSQWEFQGVFSARDLAVCACRDATYFVGPANVDEVIPHEATTWPNAFYPKSGSTLRQALPDEWITRIEDDEVRREMNPALTILNWSTDSACGELVIAIAKRADEVAGEWLDAAEDVRRAAMHQINVVCWG